MNKEISLEVALDIIGTLRMMKIDEIWEEKDENKKELLYKELDILTTEEEVANGLLQFEVSEKVRLSIMDKIENYYAPKLKAYYTALWDRDKKQKDSDIEPQTTEIVLPGVTKWYSVLGWWGRFFPHSDQSNYQNDKGFQYSTPKKFLFVSFSFIVSLSYSPAVPPISSILFISYLTRL